MTTHGFWVEHRPDPRRGYLSTSPVGGRSWVALTNRNPFPQLVLFPRLEEARLRVAEAWRVLRFGPPERW